MHKFNLRLKSIFTNEIESILSNNNIIVRHVDKVLHDFIIVETKSKVDFTKFHFIRSFKKTRIGQLLDIPKATKFPVMKAVPSPHIALNSIREKGLYGFGNKVAVIDSGHDIDSCGDVELAKNFTTHPNYYDTRGHGSLVITLIKQIIPAAKIYLAKVCVEDDKVDEEDVHRALDWVMELTDVKIINLSFGMDARCLGDCDLADKINAMAELGYIIIAAVGNKGGSLTYCPACAENAISVGALDKKGSKVASFSSSGHINSNKPDLVAPGHGEQIILGNSTEYYGTSFAAPIVSGILGATYHMFKKGTNVKEYLIRSCDSLINEPRTRQGSGRVDLQKLLEAIENEKNES